MITIAKLMDDFVWGPPLLILLVGTGIYLTSRLGLIQILKLPRAFKLIFQMMMVTEIFHPLLPLQPHLPLPLVQEILSESPLLSNQAALERSFGCG